MPMCLMTLTCVCTHGAGAGCTDPSGFCGLAGRSCALPSGGGLGSTPSTPYATSDDDLASCMAKCKSAAEAAADSTGAYLS
jgi:hypothetical protein